MSRNLDYSSAPWIRGSGPPLGHGPATRPYTPLDPGLFDRSLVEAVGQAAWRFPDRLAIDDGVMRLTYRQVYAMVCRLSHGIASFGLAPGPLGLWVNDDAFHPISLLACLAAGRPCLLLSKDNPVDYNRRLIASAGLVGLLVNAADARELSGHGGPRVIPIESILLNGGDDETPAGELGPDDPAFILATSGSTGVPKLIARSQRSLLRRIASKIESGHFNADDRVLPLGKSITPRFTPLLVGASLHLVDVRRSGMSHIFKSLRDNKITAMRMTPSIVRALAQLEDAKAHFASLRLIWCGGEMLLQRDLASARAVLPPDCLFAYGMGSTETATSRWIVPANDAHDPVRVAAGYLLPEIEALILDENGRPCATGEVGELVIRSQIVALGEWLDGHLVPSRFQSDSADATQRIYHTGDLVRLCPDGVLVVHGRKDRMLKINGQRVEPAVIEAAIRDVPGVADAAVAARQIDGDARIYGFIMPRPGLSDGLTTRVQDHLKAALPSYMRPTDLRLVDKLPTNATNKVDLNALLALVSDATGGAAPVVLPVGHEAVASAAARTMVAAAWRAAFRDSRRDSTRSFEACGGDSLQFMQIIFRLEQLSGRTMPLSAFETTMTQAAMARAVDRLIGGADDDALPVPSSQSQTVFLLPGVGGDEPRLLHFRAGCGPELSVVSLDYGDWTQWVEPGFAFESIVDRLAARIEELAPSGTIRLAGYSLGGRAAYAIATKLLASGRQIEDLLILDSEAMLTEQDVADTGPRRPPSWRDEWTEWRKGHGRGEGAFVLARIVTRRLLSPRWAPLLRWLSRHRRQVLRGKVDFYLNFHLNRSLLAHLAGAWRRNLPPASVMPFRLTLFAVDRPGRAPDCGWSPYARKVEIVKIDGDHFTMFDPPNLASLCALFRHACGVVEAVSPPSRRRQERRAS